jgi:hypothetical protein
MQTLTLFQNKEIKQIGSKTDRKKDRETDRQTDRQADRQTDVRVREADRQIGR